MKSFVRIFSLTGMLSFFFVCSLHASKVDTVETFSRAMNKTIKAVVITPDGYSTAAAYPVMYLLHGASGKNSYRDWTKSAPNITSLPDAYNFIIVCPDGNPTSWYMDAPEDPSSKYETYVADELIKFIDSKYSTIKDRSGRGITGLSMGGFGALFLAIRHQDVFGVAGSMSGGVDFRKFPTRWDLALRLGSIEKYPERWDQYTISNLIPLIKPSLPLMIDCGVGDFFLPANEELHQKLMEAKIDHDYILRPGIHSWKYWANAIKYQALFMSDAFKSAKAR